MDAKICGIKDSQTLNFLIKHTYPPKFIGFICNYPKSKRNIKFKELKRLVDIKKNNKINFVCVLVDPDENILQKMVELNFDYLQLYNVSFERTKMIKKKFKIKIITALTIKNSDDVKKYKEYNQISDIILFDSKGYEKSLGFDHQLLNVVPLNITRMLAGNIQYNDNLEKYKKITDIIDLSGSIETQGEKDISKIDIFLKNISKV